MSKMSAMAEPTGKSRTWADLMLSLLILRCAMMLVASAPTAPARAESDQDAVSCKGQENLTVEQQVSGCSIVIDGAPFKAGNLP